MIDRCCKDCQKRYLGCHAECSDYKAYCEKKKEIREKKHKDQEVYYTLYDGVIRTKNTYNPRFGRSKK